MNASKVDPVILQKSVLQSNMNKHLFAGNLFWAGMIEFGKFILLDHSQDIEHWIGKSFKKACNQIKLYGFSADFVQKSASIASKLLVVEEIKQAIVKASKVCVIHLVKIITKFSYQ